VEERESQLDDREARLFQKELQVRSQAEDAQRKVELLLEQKHEITQETKKLELLT